MFDLLLNSDFWLIFGLVLCITELTNGTLILFLPTGLSAMTLSGILKLQDNLVVPSLLTDWYYIVIIWVIISLAFAAVLRKYFKRESNEEDINKY